MNAIDQSRRRLAIAAAALAGFVDAVGFLSANSYFVSFMSGNTTRLGVDLVTSPTTALVPALLIAGFGIFWLIEHRRLAADLPADYLALRRVLSICVCVLLALTAFAASGDLA